MAFYVYEHWRLDRDECFYVGKGRAGRAYSRKGRNRHWRNIVAKLERTGWAYEVRIVASGLSEEDSLSFERERIAFWRDLVDLANITDGGDGCSGMVHSPETRELIRQNTPVRLGADHPMFGKKRPEVSERNKSRIGIPAWNKGKPFSDETRAKMSAAAMGRTPWNKGKKFSEESRAKMSASAKNRVRSAPSKRRSCSDETRQKLSAQAKEQWSKLRALGHAGNLVSVSMIEQSAALADATSYPNFETLSISRGQSRKDW